MRLPVRVIESFEDATLNFERIESVFSGPQAEPLAFLQLLSAQRLEVQIGSTSLTWAGTSADGNATVAHGLGRTPILVWAPNLVIPATRSWQCFTGAYTSTNFALLARPDGVYTGTVSFPWAVIG